MANRNWRIGLLTVLSSVALAGCLPKALDPIYIAPPAQAAPNSPPTITGTPATTVTVDGGYVFNPVATDPDGQALSYSISNKPDWAGFNTVTGQLTGTPTAAHAGAVSNILITVTDSVGASASLPAFSITVAARESVEETGAGSAEGTGAGAGRHDGSATLNWTPATQYTDGSELPPSDLTAYRIYHGRNEATLSRVAEVDSGTTAFSVTNLSPGNHLFAVTAVVATGIESGYSEIRSKYLP